MYLSRFILLIPLCFPIKCSQSPPSGSLTMGCAPSKNVDLTTEITLYHFDLHRVVGKGAFGKVRHPSSYYSLFFRSCPCIQVRVVQHKKSKKLYALKYMNKQQCMRQKAVANIIQERRLLEEVRHRSYIPFAFSTPLCRSITHSWSTSATLSKTMIIASSFLTSCLVVIFDVSPDFHLSCVGYLSYHRRSHKYQGQLSGERSSLLDSRAGLWCGISSQQWHNASVCILKFSVAAVPNVKQRYQTRQHSSGCKGTCRSYRP